MSKHVSYLGILLYVSGSNHSNIVRDTEVRYPIESKLSIFNFRTFMESFTRLNSNVYLRTPPKSIPNGTQNGIQNDSATLPPTTIIFFAWFAALPRYYAKFLTYYTQTYPDARIILVLSNPDIFYRSYAAQQRNLEPAITAILADSSNRRLLVHAASNGGANGLCNLLVAYRQSTGQVLPVQALVLDSAPGRAGVRSGMNAMRLSLPMHPVLKLPALLIAFVVFAVARYLYPLFSVENFVDRARRLLNDPQTSTLEAKRCYMYSKTDELVALTDVEDHSRDAEKQGYKVTRTVFSGSGHVAHMKMDSEKYWNALQRLWKSTSTET